MAMRPLLRVSCRNFLQCDCKPTKLFLKVDRCEFVTLWVNKLSNLAWLCKCTSCLEKNFCCETGSKQIHKQDSVRIPTKSWHVPKSSYLFYTTTTKTMSASCPHLQPVVLRMGGNFRISAWQSFTPWWPDPLHRRQGSVCQPRASPHLVKVKARMDEKLGRKLKQREFC